MRRQTVYPEWVQQYRTTGKTIKKVGDNYYLYHHTSKRVPGKKYPVPVDTYIGVITPEGLVEGTKKKVSTQSIVVREYGFSYALKECCPDSWKAVAGKNYDAKLRKIIKNRSKLSYLDDTPEMDSIRGQIGSMASSLQRHLKESYGVTLDELQMLDSIFIVTISGKSFISDVNDAQRTLLDKVQVHLGGASTQ